jgi:hypothetical protein
LEDFDVQRVKSAEWRTDPALSRNLKPPPFRRWSVHRFGSPVARDAQPEFREAMIRARELSLAYWEGLARNQVGNRDFNSNLYRIAMLGRFSAEYREGKVVVEHQQPSGVDLSKLSPEEREQLAALLQKAKIPTSPGLPDGQMADSRDSVH